MTPVGTKRVMTIVHAPGFDQHLRKPMLKIANRFLRESGFTIGTKVEVGYGRGILIIRKLPNV